MTASNKELIGPSGPQEPQQQQISEPQTEISQMIIDLEEQPPCVTEPQQLLLAQPKGSPEYLPRDSVVEDTAPRTNETGPTDHQPGDNRAEDDDPADGFYENDTSSEGDSRQAEVVAWVDSPGIAADVVAQSSDEYEDGMDDIRDEEEDDEDEDEDDIEDDDNFSDDTGDTDELHEAPGKSYLYSRTLHHGTYPKSRQQVEQLRKNQGRPAALRKRSLKQRTISGASESGATSSSTFTPVQDVTIEEATAQQLFTLTCEEVTRALHHGPIQQGVDIVKGLIESNIEWRNTGEIPSRCNHSAEQLRLLEDTFFATWAKILVERRPSTYTVAIVKLLKDFVHLGYLMVQQDATLPELHAQVMNSMFEGDLEIYKRNSKRPSRLAHIERIGHFDEYVSEYGPEDEEVPQLQQDFQRLFSTLGGVDTCMNAIESHLEGEEYPDIPVAGDSEHSAISKLTELSKRLISAVLGFFPDNADSFRSVSKAAVLEIISQVGYFLLENYRLQSLHPNMVLEPDTDYGDFDLNDPVSRSNLGEVKFADFRLEMAVRLMKTSRLDLRLAGLMELKEVLVRIQRLQQGRARMRRRSEADMDVQMELDRKPIE
ncbi:hypothetical protein BGZ58_002552 [Dissophora ornata]|nr:hypothetical protein BGZ58_002552 [Dissophora ornata]